MWLWLGMGGRSDLDEGKHSRNEILLLYYRTRVNQQVCTMPTTTLLNTVNMERNYMQSVGNIEETSSQDTRKCDTSKEQKEGQRLYVPCQRLLT
jgi:hypothetical protein